MKLQREFERLAHLLEQTLSLLEESEHTFWLAYLRRGLNKVNKAELAGATFVLGCYNGADTFADLVIGEQWQDTDPVRFRNLNARLQQLRTEVFESAGLIASRRLW